MNNQKTEEVEKVVPLVEEVKKTEPIEVPTKKNKNKKTPEEIAYRRKREDLRLKKQELDSLRDEVKKMKCDRIKKIKKTPYREFCCNFSKNNKGKHGKCYSKELSKAWKAFKETK